MTRELPFPVVCIGVSASELRALEGFFGSTPSYPRIAFLIVTHLAPDRESFLTDIRLRHSGKPARVAYQGQKIDANGAYIRPPIPSCRKLADEPILSEALAMFFQPDRDRIVLSGPYILLPELALSSGVNIKGLATGAEKSCALSKYDSRKCCGRLFCDRRSRRPAAHSDIKLARKQRAARDEAAKKGFRPEGYLKRNRYRRRRLRFLGTRLVGIFRDSAARGSGDDILTMRDAKSP